MNKLKKTILIATLLLSFNAFATSAFSHPMRCGMWTLARIVKDPENPADRHIVETHRPIFSRIEQIVVADDGTESVQTSDPFGNVYENYEEIVPYLNPEFPSLADFKNTVTSTYAGTVPANVPGWDETWRIVTSGGEDENYYFDYGSYGAEFSGTADYFTYPFSMTTTFTLNCSDVDQVALSVSSDDNASISVLGKSCSSTLHNDASLLIEVPEGTTSFPVTVTYENIGGPYFMKFSIELRKRH